MALFPETYKWELGQSMKENRVNIETLREECRVLIRKRKDQMATPGFLDKGDLLSILL
jgi:hypothetical protein